MSGLEIVEQGTDSEDEDDSDDESVVNDDEPPTVHGEKGSKGAVSEPVGVVEPDIQEENEEDDEEEEVQRVYAVEPVQVGFHSVFFMLTGLAG